jgi:hypothetical protein
MRYRIPEDHIAVDLLTEAEYDNAPTERARIERGRAKAWALRRVNGPTGQLRELALRDIGDSIVLAGYTRSGQISALTAAVSVDEGVQFSCALERSLIDGAVIGVRVTLVAFTR